MSFYSLRPPHFQIKFLFLVHEIHSLIISKLQNNLYQRDAEDLVALEPLLSPLMDRLERDDFAESKPEKKNILDHFRKPQGGEMPAVVIEGKARPKVVWTREEAWLGLQTL